MGPREVIWALEGANRRPFRAFQLKKNSATSSRSHSSRPAGHSTTGCTIIMLDRAGLAPDLLWTTAA